MSLEGRLRKIIPITKTLKFVIMAQRITIIRGKIGLFKVFITQRALLGYYSASF